MEYRAARRADMHIGRMVRSLKVGREPGFDGVVTRVLGEFQGVPEYEVRRYADNTRWCRSLDELTVAKGSEP